MKTIRWFLAGVGAVCLGGQAWPLTGRPGRSDAQAAPTYTKDVAPILFKNCTSCHRPGEIAPMSLLTYDDVRPHAKDIRDEVERRTHAAVARGGAEGYVPQRARADRRGEEDAPGVGEHGRAEGRPEGPAADAGLSRRLGHRQAGRRVRDAGGVQGPGRRRDRVRVLLHPDQLHRAEVDPGDRAATRQPRGRASRARVLPGQARHAAAAGAAAEPRADGAAAAAESRARGRSARIGRRAACSRPTLPGTNPQVLGPAPRFGSSPAA